jgi:hypothetical protein
MKLSPPMHHDVLEKNSIVKTPPGMSAGCMWSVSMKNGMHTFKVRFGVSGVVDHASILGFAFKVFASPLVGRTEEFMQADYRQKFIYHSLTRPGRRGRVRSHPGLGRSPRHTT